MPVSPSESTSEERARSLLNALQGRLPAQNVPVPYRIGLFLATLMMVLLPVVYMGLIGLVAWALYWECNVLYQPLVVESRKASGMVIFFGLLVSGVIMIVFMIKPLFAPRAKKDTLRTLKRAEEPQLFAFVDRLCAVIGAPNPREIQVNNDVNAAAGLRRGVLSLFDRGDLVLIIGLPLAGGLTLQQFAGVLAHEFGHFSQATGMRLSWVIRSMNAWFLRVVYERDAWDEFLISACSWDIRVSFPFYLARLFVWLSRKVLWVLMMLGHLITCYLLRQMEYDADTYEARLAGSRAFADTARRLPVLGVASQAAHHALSEFWTEGRLADDFPGLVAAKVGEMKPELIEKIHKLYGERKTGWFETHPSDRDRVAAVERLNAAGLFNWEGPATQLFGNYTELCRKASWDFYKEKLGDKVKRENIHPLSDLLGRQEKTQEGHKAIERYLQRGLSLLRPLALGEMPKPEALTLVLDGEEPPPPKPPVDESVLKEDLNVLRAQLMKLAPAHVQLLDDYSGHYKRKTQTLQAEVLLKSNYKINAKEFQLNEASLKGAAHAIAQVENQFERLNPQLLRFDQVASERLRVGLNYLHSSGAVENHLELKPFAETAKKLRPVLTLLNQVVPKVLEATEKLAMAGILLNQLQNNKEPTPALVGELRSICSGLESRLGKLQKQMGDTPYPFDHAKGQVLLSEWVFRSKHLPSGDAIGEILQETDHAWERLSDLYIRVLGQLTLASEAVEKALGLEPLPVPPEKKEPEESEKK